MPAEHEIGGYAGRRYPPASAEEAWDDRLTYLFGLSDGSMIDGGQGGNATRHLNHSCEPNVEAIERYDGDDDLVIVIRTLRAIERGSELFLDYGLDVDGDDPAMYPCSCESSKCRGTIAAKRPR
jgi:SET domain-containing protein